MSETMKQYVAGQLLLIPQFLPLFAPTVNSYKRLVEGAWAPTTLTWGVDNRTVALRVLSGGKIILQTGNPGDRLGCKSLPGHGWCPGCGPLRYKK